MPFGGMLGSTFNFVFEVQMEKLQSGDRFYYLQRLDGLHLFGEMENNSFAAMIMRNTDATHLAVGRVLDAWPDPRGRPDQAVQRPRTATAFSRQRRSESAAACSTQLVVRNNPATVGPIQLPALHRRRARRARRHRRATTSSSPASATTRSSATAATTGSKAASATTSSTAATATTSSSTPAATTTSRPATATTSSTPVRASTS